ncbi:MAG TPA: radical SAM protein [bacterium]|nr:radical SAM protein [bacterium]HPN34067.1 radical SAM protein [bacterium]
MNKLLKLLRLAGKNPSIAAAKAAITWRNQVSVKWDYRRKDGTARPPSTLCIKLTNSCNLACKMCGQPRENLASDDVKYAPETFFRQKVAVSGYRALIDEVQRFRPNLYLWGGEPFIYTDIFDLIEHGKNRRLTCQVNTNGLYIKKYARELVDSGLDDLIVSIDGPEAVHDQVRGLPGAFRLVQAGLQALQEEKKRRGATKPIVRVRGTICPENFEHLYALTGIAKSLAADSLNFNWTWFTTHAAGAAHQQLMKRLFDIEALSWRPFESDLVMDPEKRRRLDGIREQLIKLENNRENFLITLSPNVRPKEVERYYTDIRYTFGSERCYAVWLKSYILPNGDVTPCPDYPDFIAGNILQQPFMEIWNGERYKHWRRELRARGLFPVCYRCCDLFLSNLAVV